MLKCEDNLRTIVVLQCATSIADHISCIVHRTMVSYLACQRLLRHQRSGGPDARAVYLQ